MTTGNARYARLPGILPTRINFGLLTRDEIQRMAVCDVTEPGLNTQLAQSAVHTLYDRSMGPIDSNERCLTCEQTLRNCPGHFGLIRLPLPMPHPLFAKDYVNLLGAFCNVYTDDDRPGHEHEKVLCLKPLLSMDVIEQYANLPATRRWRRTVGSNQKVCPYRAEHSSEQRQWVYYTDTDPHGGDYPFRLILRTKGRNGEPDNDEIMNPARVQKWVAERISAESLAQLGLGHLANTNIHTQSPTTAEQFVQDLLLVLPNPMRLPTKGDGAQGIIHADLTNIYSQILSKKNDLEEIIKKDGKVGIPAWDESMDGYFKNKISSKYKEMCALMLRFYRNKDNACREMHGQRAYKGVVEHIDGKEGIFRQDILAGRSNNTARTVIASSPSIGVDEVGIPQEICDKLIQVETVTSYNIDKIKELAKKGKIKTIKGGPQRERRGDVCIDTSEVLPIPTDVERLRKAIAKQEREGQEIDTVQLREELGVTNDQLEQLFELHQQYKDEEEARNKKIATCIDSIAPGDQIERNLMKGDIVTVSRQPILRKYSIMAHYVVPVPGKAILIADGSNQPYNAD